MSLSVRFSACLCVSLSVMSSGIFPGFFAFNSEDVYKYLWCEVSMVSLAECSFFFFHKALSGLPTTVQQGGEGLNLLFRTSDIIYGLDFCCAPRPTRH